MSDDFTFVFEDEEIRNALAEYQRIFGNPRRLMRYMAGLGENKARQNFANETDPSGNSWVDSERKRIKGGKTLTDTGRLADSMSSNFGDYFAEWGTAGVDYAIFHQKGTRKMPQRKMFADKISEFPKDEFLAKFAEIMSSV